MTKLQERVQGSDTLETYIFKCYCGEDSYVEITADKEDGDIYLTITKHPTRLKERLSMAWKALRGIEFTASNSVMITVEDLPKLVAALNGGATKVTGMAESDANASTDVANPPKESRKP